MLTFHDVDKRFRLRDGYKVILDHVSLHIPACNVGILGANGAGKSTLLRMISGADYPDSGMIECHRKVSFPLGFAGSFKGTLTGIENTLFVSRIYGQDTEAVVEYVKEFSQLGEQLYMPLQTYSSGMRARLAFGVSLAIDFEMYLVDEITAVGDAKFRQSSKRAFQDKLASANMVMVSHSTNTLRDYCQAGLVLHEGQLHYYPDIEDAIEHHDSNMGEPGEDDADRGKEARKRKKQQERKQRRSPEEKEQLVAERQAARQLKREKKAAEKQAAQQQQELAAQAQLYPQQSIDMGPPPLPATRNDQN